MNLNERLKKIKLLATDFDGVMTDACVYIGEDGKESVRCSRRDGLGVEMLKNAGIEIIVLSKEPNSVVIARCKKLGIACTNNINDSSGKLAILKEIIKEKNIDLSEVAYIGDDLNDRAVLENAGVAITVADGHKKIKSLCDFITKAKGGDHAFREVCEKILEAKGIALDF
ncbi:MAG: HAD hydrolase family protein [Patescibacteria group bacterium]